MENIRSFIGMRRRIAFQLGIGLILAWTSPSWAGFTQEFQLHEVNYTQSSNAAPASASTAYYLARPTSTTSPDFTGVTVTPPAGSPLVLTESPAGSGFWDSGLFSHAFANQALLDAAFPVGSYTVTGTGGSTPTSATIAETQSAYPVTHPFLTGTTYSSLQGLNPALPVTINWDSFVAAAGATGSALSLSISGPSGSVFNQFLPVATTAQSFPANTFAANAAYTLQLAWYSDVTSTSAGGVFLDDRFGNAVTATYTTGNVPEPSSLALAAVAMGLVGWRRRGRAGTGRVGK